MICLYLSTEKYSPVSMPIRWNTRCPWSHAGFYLSASHAYLSAQLRGGVRVRWTDGIKYPEKFSAIAFYTAPKVEEAYNWARGQVGKPYDWTAITGLALNRNWREDDSWFCSELVAAAFEAVGAPLFAEGMCAWRVTPRDLTTSLAVKPISFP